MHGYFRDCWYNPTYDNYFRLLKALEDLGEDVQDFKEDQTPNPKSSFFKFSFQDFTLDLLPQIKAPLNFFSSYSKREIVKLNGIDIPFINFEDLIEDKNATARKKDVDDIRNLKNNNFD